MRGLTSWSRSPVRRIHVILTTIIVFVLLFNYYFFLPSNSATIPINYKPTRPYCHSCKADVENQVGIAIIILQEQSFYDEHKKYFDWAIVTMESIRINGKFMGPIYLIVDDEKHFRMPSKASLISKLNITIIIVEVSQEKPFRVNESLLKLNLRNYIPKNNILYISPGTIVTAPINSFLQGCLERISTCKLITFKDNFSSIKFQNQPFETFLFFYSDPKFIQEWYNTYRSNTFMNDQQALYSVLSGSDSLDDVCLWETDYIQHIQPINLNIAYDAPLFLYFSKHNFSWFNSNQLKLLLSNYNLTTDGHHFGTTLRRSGDAEAWTKWEIL